MGINTMLMIPFTIYRLSSGLGQFSFYEILLAFKRYALFPRKKWCITRVILTFKILYLLFIMHIHLVYVNISVTKYQTISNFNLYHPNHNRRELVLQQHKMGNFFLVFKYNLNCWDFSPEPYSWPVQTSSHGIYIPRKQKGGHGLWRYLTLEGSQHPISCILLVQASHKLGSDSSR